MLESNVVAFAKQPAYHPVMASERFDVQGFHAALDSIRRSRGMTWRQVALGAKVSASSLTRMAKGSRPDIDTVASLAVWASLDASAFFPQDTTQSPLSMVTAYIHRDPSLTPTAASALEQLVRATHSQLTDGADSR
jgi:transcriptional regulator with XRE-family HTH domain